MTGTEYKQWLDTLKAADDVVIIPGGYKKEPIKAMVLSRNSRFIYTDKGSFSNVHGYEVTGRQFRARITAVRVA